MAMSEISQENQEKWVSQCDCFLTEGQVWPERMWPEEAVKCREMTDLFRASSAGQFHLYTLLQFCNPLLSSIRLLC